MSQTSLNDNPPTKEAKGGTDPPSVVDWETKYKRSLADWENEKKTWQQLTAHQIEATFLNILMRFLPFYESLRVASNQNGEYKSLKDQFGNILRACGVERMETALGQSFDPLYHEAVDKRQAEGVGPQTILGEVASGYLYKNKVLKPAKVIVSI